MTPLSFSFAYLLFFFVFTTASVKAHYWNSYWLHQRINDHLVYHEPTCLHGNNSLTSNIPLVTYLSKHQTFMHLTIVNMVSIYINFDAMVWLNILIFGSNRGYVIIHLTCWLKFFWICIVIIWMYHFTKASFQVQPDMIFLHGPNLLHYPRMHNINALPLHFGLPLHCVGEASGQWFCVYPVKPYCRIPYWFCAISYFSRSANWTQRCPKFVVVW